MSREAGWAHEEGTERFLRTVRERAADVDSDGEARAVTEAVLEELARRLTGGAAESLATLLPAFAARALRSGGPDGEGAGTDEFLTAVARREGDPYADPATVAGHVQAVFRAVAEAADREALQAARRQLTVELGRLWVPESEDEVEDQAA